MKARMLGLLGLKQGLYSFFHPLPPPVASSISGSKCLKQIWSVSHQVLSENLLWNRDSAHWGYRHSAPFMTLSFWSGIHYYCPDCDAHCTKWRGQHTFLEEVSECHPKRAFLVFRFWWILSGEVVFSCTPFLFENHCCYWKRCLMGARCSREQLGVRGRAAMYSFCRLLTHRSHTGTTPKTKMN